MTTASAVPSIRRATSTDAAGLSAFAASVFPLGCPETAPSDLAAYIAAELSPAAFRALLENPNVLVLLAETFAVQPAAAETKPIVAYMVVARSSSHPLLSAPVLAEFRKLYLDPAYHGSGLADELMQSAFAILHAEGLRPIWLSTFSGNSRAIAFYKKWGFRIVGTQEFVVGTDRQKDFLMLYDPDSASGPEFD
jgi:ribosomal protein S18 acetylase RimI-like enzyme